ncbi:MAG: hypothetical protein AAFR24_07015 [Cyanobacteria bacterium J06627_3]
MCLWLAIALSTTKNLPMATANPILAAGSTLAIGLLLSPPVLAHNGELHGQDAAPEKPAPAVNSPSNNRSEPVVVESVLETAPSTAPSLDRLTIDPGDLLFGLMVVFPWALIVLRKQLHLPHRP